MRVLLWVPSSAEGCVRGVFSEGFEGLFEGLQEGFAADALTGMADEVGDAPAAGPDGLALAYPSPLFLDTPCRCREEVHALAFAAQPGFARRFPSVMDRWKQGFSDFTLLGTGC